MDLHPFKEMNFNPKAWINKMFGLKGKQSNQAFVLNSVQRLQLYMKQLNIAVQESNAQLVSDIPTTIRDTSLLKRECHLLHERLLGLQEHLMDVETETGQSIKCLQQIDDLKCKLENAALTLREADQWEALSRGLEDVLEAGISDKVEKLVDLAEQVRAMSAGMDNLATCPNGENKKMQLDSLYNRIEASITLPFLTALSSMDQELTSTYVSIFSGMRRSLSASRCWRRAAATHVAQRWSRMSTHTVRNLTQLLAEDAGKQVEWLTTVLKCETPLTELLRLQTDLLLSLEPSPAKIVKADFKLLQSPEESITFLIDLRTDLDEFIDLMKVMVDTINANSNEEISPPVMREFGLAVYSPLRELLQQYTEVQIQVFMAYLDDPNLKQDDLLEYSRAIVSLADKTEMRLITAYTRGVEIAGPAIYPFYAPAVEHFIASLLNLISSHTRIIETQFLKTISSGEPAGVLSETFPASLVLENATATLLETLARRQLVVEQEEVVYDDEAPHPLRDLRTFLLNEDTKRIVKEAPPSASTLRRARETLKVLSRSILRNPIDVQLEKIPQLSEWHNNDSLSTDLPDFALSPQEYITEIGQYLMTLPQHLEMHVSDKQATWQFLTQLCTHTCEVYAEKILNIRNMDALGTKRCLTDIVYLSSVVEDLGSNITPALKNLEKSLRAATPSHGE